MYYAGGASSLITGVYFALSPHIEPLMPATLLNGYDVRQGSGRADDLNLYPFLDSIIRGLLEQKVGFSCPAICGFRRGSISLQSLPIGAIFQTAWSR